MVFRRHAGLVKTSLATLLPHAEAPDPVVLASSLQVDESILAACLDLYHLSLHFTTAPAFDKVVTSGDGESLKARRLLVAGRGLKLRSGSAEILLELMRFHFTNDLLCKIEEYERAAPPFQNVSGESVSPTMKVGIVFNTLGDTVLASRLAINAERLEEWHDFKTELTNVLNAGVVDISRARAAAAGAHTLARKNTPNSGTRSTDVDAVSKGAGKGGGSESRIRLNCGNLDT